MAKISYIILIILYVSLNIEPNFSQSCGLSSNKLKDANKDNISGTNIDSSSEDVGNYRTLIEPRILSRGSSTITPKTEFSWIVQIHKKSTFAEFLCAGSLINENVILTVGHCLNTVKANSIEVRAGIKYSLIGNKDDVEPEIRNVTSIVIHNKFDLNKLINNIGLVFLESPLSFTNTISSVCIPPVNTNFDDKICFVSGWGRSETNSPGGENELRTVDVPVVSNRKCLAELRQTALGPKFHFHSSYLCAGGELGKDACSGDGGAPLMCLIDGTNDVYYQAGIVSWGMGCGTKGLPGVYTNVAAFKPWIDEQVMFRGITKNTYTY